MPDQRIDFDKEPRIEKPPAEHEPRPQTERERNPDYFQRRQETEGRSEWSGGRMVGGTWGGRSR
jgi:hypothetical protein